MATLTATAPSEKMNLGKYRSLDAWRGLAALSVVLFHGVIFLPTPPASSGEWLIEVLRRGYLGVFIFFPISGYCILNALVASDGLGAWGFFRRRVWRIYPAYWGSLVLIYLAIFVAMPFNGTRIADLGMEWWKWVSLFTLTQGFTCPGIVNVVYWTLGLEVQFYLIMGCLLFFKPGWRPQLLLLSALLGCLYRMPWWNWHVQGLFLEAWLEFLGGAAVIAWRVPAYGPRWSVVVWILAMITAGITLSLELSISLLVSWSLMILYRWDDLIMSWPLIRLLSFYGMFSYSLYLIHYPMMSQAINLLLRFVSVSSATMYWGLMVVLIAVATAAGLALYYAVERPCILQIKRMKS